MFSVKAILKISHIQDAKICICYSIIIDITTVDNDERIDITILYGCGY